MIVFQFSFFGDLYVLNILIIMSSVVSDNFKESDDLNKLKNLFFQSRIYFNCLTCSGLTMMSLCWTSCSWDISCCCCIWSWWKAGELLALSDWRRWVCWTKLTCSCSWSCGTSCSSCFLPASAPCWTSCCSWVGLRLENGELWSSWCICWRPGGRRGSWRGVTGDILPDSDSLKWYNPLCLVLSI